MKGILIDWRPIFNLLPVLGLKVCKSRQSTKTKFTNSQTNL